MDNAKNTENKALRWGITISYLLTVAVNILANIIPIGYGTTADISEKYPNLFTPAPLTFGIWGVIYLLMAVYVLSLWGVFGTDTEQRNELYKVGVWFIAGSAFNIAWIFAWHFDKITLSCLMLALLLVSLAVIVKLKKNFCEGGTAVFFANAGFEIYFGWLIAALIANISVLLVKVGWNGFGISHVVWTCIILIVGAVIGALPSFVDCVRLSTLAVVWAYVGIVIRHVKSGGYNSRYPAIIASAIIGIIIMLLSVAAKSRAGQCKSKCKSGKKQR